MQHNEYPVQLHIQGIAQECSRAVTRWKTNGGWLPVEDFELRWGYQQAVKLADSLNQMLVAYNQVLYTQLPYCDSCGGRCCGLGSVKVNRFDLLALALLDQTFPLLPASRRINARDCIYQTLKGCSWPAAWRTMKCWSFYCLGNSGWQLADGVEARYQQIACKLEPPVSALMPDELRVYQFSTDLDLVTHLHDPLAFAYQLGKALDDILAVPFFEHYGLPDPLESETVSHDSSRLTDLELEALLADERCSELVTAIMELLDDGEVLPGTSGQIMEDLEQLEWITLGRPYNDLALLAGISQRYVDTGPLLNNLAYAHMYDLILYLLEREGYECRYNQIL